MTKKIIYAIISIVLLVAAALAIRFYYGGAEDMWLCQDGKWVKHGRPDSPQPQTVCTENGPVGGDKDEHGCLVAAGYMYCPSTGKCQRMWEEYCKEYENAYRGTDDDPAISNFEECAAIGNPVMESFPRQCRHEDKLFLEGSETGAGTSTPGTASSSESQSDLIVLDSPVPEQKVSSPLLVQGRARGTWFFEAVFPVVLTDWDGRIIAEGQARAQGDWMTEEFVPFAAELTFSADTSVSDRGALILRKSNPSGLPESDDALEITVFFQ